ncbi:hypothetical protein H4Q26_002820 [Puccinia striiformis f. sp. tritici PST-130]|nr:hypothetical protein H4Q26_002820 [Puccinia striiformis f. sp. tritici PST-130]
MYFSCHKNWDAICARLDVPGDTIRIYWAIRLYEGKRHYLCINNRYAYCCPQGLFAGISTNPNHYLDINPDDRHPCQGGGQ